MSVNSSKDKKTFTQEVEIAHLTAFPWYCKHPKTRTPIDPAIDVKHNVKNCCCTVCGPCEASGLNTADIIRCWTELDDDCVGKEIGVSVLRRISHFNLGDDVPMGQY
jgi:hypothetical protein